MTLGDRQCTSFNGICKLRVKLKVCIDVIKGKNFVGVIILENKVLRGGLKEKCDICRFIVFDRCE